MAAKYSNGLRNAMLVTDPFRTLMNLSVLKIYAGTEPATADAALGGATLLCTVTNNGTATGLTFETSATDGVVTKTVAEVWRGTNAASGTATFCRLVTSSDDGLASTSQYRVQGTVGVVGAQLNLSSTSLVASATQDIDFFAVALPTN